MARQVKIGIALGSGAARGWSHIGVLEVLSEAGVVPTIVCGSSMGALVGAAFAAGRIEALKEWALGADWRAVVSLVDLGLRAGGLVDGVKIVNWLDAIGVTGAIERMPMPFAAVATDLTSGREIWLRDGDLRTAIRASIALPGIFSPISIDGRWLVDGGLVNPVPVSVCRALGADFIIAVGLHEDVLGKQLVAHAEPEPSDEIVKSGNLIDMVRALPKSLGGQANLMGLFGSGAPAPAYFDVLANSINIMQDQITRSRLAGEPPQAQILPLVSQIGLMDFHRAATAIAEGRAAAERALPHIEARLKSAF